MTRRFGEGEEEECKYAANQQHTAATACLFGYLQREATIRVPVHMTRANFRATLSLNSQTDTTKSPHVLKHSLVHTKPKVTYLSITSI